MSDDSTLKDGEPHPMAYKSLEYLKSLDPKFLLLAEESYASCALSGNRMAQICLGTLSRLKKGLPVSDRYIMGLELSVRGLAQTLTIKEEHTNQKDDSRRKTKIRNGRRNRLQDGDEEHV